MSAPTPVGRGPWERAVSLARLPPQELLVALLTAQQAPHRGTYGFTLREARVAGRSGLPAGTVHDVLKSLHAAGWLTGTTDRCRLTVPTAAALDRPEPTA